MVWIRQYTTDPEDGRRILPISRSDENVRNERRPRPRDGSDKEVCSDRPHSHTESRLSRNTTGTCQRTGKGAFKDVIYGSESDVDLEEE
jgi:hypothetical protein